MRIVAAICVLALSANAQIGPSGIVSPDGNNLQFSHDFANNVAVRGPSGIVTKDGNNLQLTPGQASLLPPVPVHAAPVPAPVPVTLPDFITSHGIVLGHSGIVNPDGNNVQFSQALADDIILYGPSGVVTKSGNNIQLPGLRVRRATPGGAAENFLHLVGDSGIITKDGQLIQLEPGVTVILAGPSGVILSNGKNIQF